MIELALLGLLSEQDLHGYELKKQLGELLGSSGSRGAAISFGSLYPALARLEKGGLVKAVEANPGPAEPAVPMTGALSGELAAFRTRLAPKAKPGRRGKKVYGITDAGRDRFHELLTDPGPDDERSFALRVALCRHLRPDERLALFERRKAELTGQLATRRHRDPQRDSRGETRADRAGARRSDPYVRLLRDRDTRALTSDLAWVDELLATARADVDADRAATAEATTVGNGWPSLLSADDIALAAPTARLARPPAGRNPGPVDPGPVGDPSSPSALPTTSLVPPAPEAERSPKAGTHP